MSRAHLLLLGLILAFAAAVRVYGLSTQGYWTDELCTLSEADGHGLELGNGPADCVLPATPVCTRLADARPAWAIVPALARQDTHPPLYFLLVRLWMGCFGDAEAAVRSLGVCCSVAAVGLLYAAAEPDVGPTAALWACLVMAVASPQVQFAQEARDYMPVVTLSLAAVVAGRRLPGRGAAIVFGGSLLLMMLTNYLAAGVAAVVVGWAVAGRTSRRSAVVATAVAAVAFLVLWGWAVPMQWRSTLGETAWLTDVVPGHATRAAVSLLDLPVRWVADASWPGRVAGGVLFLAVPWAFVVRKNLRLWAAWVAVPTAAVALGDFARHTSQLTLLRYTLFATPGAYVLLAAAGRRGGWWVPALAVVGGMVALPEAYSPPFKADFKDPVRSVGRHLGTADALVISGPDLLTARITLAAAEHYLSPMPATVALLTRPAKEPTLARLAACRQVGVLWLWPDRPIGAFLPGYQPDDSGVVPHFGTVTVGHISHGGATRP